MAQNSVLKIMNNARFWIDSSELHTYTACEQKCAALLYCCLIHTFCSLLIVTFFLPCQTPSKRHHEVQLLYDTPAAERVLSAQPISLADFNMVRTNNNVTVQSAVDLIDLKIFCK